MKSLEERQKARAAARNEQKAAQDVYVPQANYSHMKKAQLVAEVERRGYTVEKSDTVESLIQTLKDDDAEKAGQSDQQPTE